MITQEKLNFLIKQAITNIENKKFKETNDTALLSLRVLSAAIVKLCKDAFSLLENKHVYTACSLSCLITEAQIQLLGLDKHFDTNGKDYYEFAYVEQLKSLPINPEWREKTLLRMHEHNCERFYKKNNKNKNITDINCYNKYWYSSLASNIEQLSEIAFPHFKDLFHKQGISFIEEDLNINLLYENYRTLCSFKHFSPFLVGDTFLVQGKLHEDPRINHHEVAAKSIYVALLSVILVLNRHNENIPI